MISTKTLAPVLALTLWGLSHAPLEAAPRPAPVEQYAIHADGGLVYDPLRREAERTGALARYAKAETEPGNITQGNWQLDFRLPKRCEAYDTIPIPYELKWKGAGEIPKDSCPVAVEAVAFEDAAAREHRDLFDLALPGRIDMKVEYLGSITAHLKPEERNNMKPDCTDTTGTYPSFAREPLVRSGVAQAGDLVWFKFRYTNTGDTILDAEGFGGCLLYPELLKRNAAGKMEKFANLYNLYSRNLSYMYPGDSAESLVPFQDSRARAACGVLPAGTRRLHDPLPTGLPLLPGCGALPECLGWPHLLRERPAHPCGGQPARDTRERGASGANRGTAGRGENPGSGRRSQRPSEPVLPHEWEEFMTAFDCHLAPPADKSAVLTGTLHLQVAPWTKEVVVRLVDSNPLSVKTLALPLDVGTKSLAVRFNAATPAWVLRGGQAEPVFLSQLMADMRTNVQIDPFPEKGILDRLRVMMEAGVNVVATTSMPWLYGDMSNPAFNYPGDAWKYFLDLARQEGMRVEGVGHLSL